MTGWQEDNDKEITVRKTIWEILQIRPIKLELGGGSKPVGGYINVDIRDIPEVDFIADVTMLEEFTDGCVDAIMAKDVLQCFHREEAVTILRRWFRKLRRGSRIVIQVPDMEQIFSLYSEKKVCNCWDASTKKADNNCIKCDGKATLNYDKFQNYLYGRNRPYEVFKSAYDMKDLEALIEKAGFTITEKQNKSLRVVIVAKKLPK